MKNVGILLASYNGEKYIKNQLDSIIKQKDVKLHIFISDDKSTDNTLKIIQSYCKQYKNIECINQDRIGGPGKNFYFLINYINSKNFDYIALSDQDDIWPEYRLSRSIDELQKHDAEGYSSNVIAVDETERFIKIINKSYPQKKYDFFFETPGPGCSYVLTSNLIDLLQSKLKSNYSFMDFPYHDWLIYAIARFHGMKWIIDESPNLMYRQHNNNFIGANYGIVNRLKRINRILFGTYYSDLNCLHNILISDKCLTFSRTWYYIFRFRNTRRNLLHSILMIPFLMILSIQKK